MYRERDDKPFEEVLTVKPGDTFVPIMFTFDNKQLLALSNIGRDKQALVKFDPVSKAFKETIYENAAADVMDFEISYKKKAILSAVYETDRVHVHYLDSEYEELNKAISGKLPQGHSFGIIGNPLSEERVLVRSYSDKTRGAYYFYDRKTERLEKIADVSPWLDENRMADMKPISYRTRDGLTVHGYLTLPPSAEGRNLPTVVIPHGGPWSRDSWGFDPEVQLLASRGYAVLLMNFRGSTGYGKAFTNAGNKEWGKAMQNDITDGVQWLINQGIADPKRVAIYGGSYGGYAALAGVTFTPDLYAAGVTYVGPSSMFTFLNTLPPYWEPDRQILYSQVCDPVADRKLLEDASPLLHADRIKVPVMFAHGLNDPRVNKIESDQMVTVLRKLGIDSPYMLKRDEGHGYQEPANRYDFYQALLRFLDKYVKGA